MKIFQSLLVAVCLSTSLAEAGQPLPLSGLWFDPALDGEGYNVIQSANGITVFYFGYDSQGDRLWLVTETADLDITPANQVSLVVFVNDNGSFQVPAPSADLVEWGRLDLLLDDCSQGTFTLEGTDGNKTSSVTLLASIDGVDTAPCDNITPTPTAPFVLTSSAFQPGQRIPDRHTCNGVDIAPAVAWTGVPAGTTSLALIMDDENPPCGSGAQACRHWQVYNIPATVQAFAEDEDLALIDGVEVGAAYNFLNAYQGPCPPNQHTYNFTLYALRSSMPVLNGALAMTRSRFTDRYGEHIIADTTLNAFYP